ncbi:hypothetical protein SCAR479_13338 [Seiridium cardinale]|uniref:Uncharacterized protein n=1 Tax=Seiridium cardinale TaxID=138064 RepID=A0ABR2X888_9PEZI
MLKLPVIVALAAASLAIAASVEQRAISSTHTATFNELEANYFIEPDTTPIGFYGGLYYKLIYSFQGDGPIDGTVFASSGVVMAVAINGTRPYITSRYRNSGITSFDFKSLNLACSAGLNFGIPGTFVSYSGASCNITITGYKGTIKTAQQTIRYTAIGDFLDGWRTIPVRLDATFTGVDTVRFRATYELVPDYTEYGIHMDDVKYVFH